jgi:sterol 24-C-methyltransferase
MLCCVCPSSTSPLSPQTLRLAPAGSTKMHGNLTTGAVTLYEGGKLGIFTPMYFFAARKPATSR